MGWASPSKKGRSSAFWGRTEPGGVLEGILAGGGAWYLSNWFSLAVPALGALVPAAVGHL